MVDEYIRISNIATKHRFVHLREILSANKFERKLFVLFLDTSRHPRFILGSIFVSADLKLDRVVSWSLDSH